MRETFKLFLVAVTAAAAASWATPRAQPLDAEFRSLHVEDFAAAGEVRMFSVDADASVAGAQCPAGWTPFTAAAGRFPVAVTNSGTLAGTLGAAYADTDGPVRRGGTAQRVTAQPSATWTGSFRGRRVTPSATFSGRRVTPSATFSGSRVTPTATFSGSRVTPTGRISLGAHQHPATFSGSPVTPTATFRGTAASHSHDYRRGIGIGDTERVNVGGLFGAYAQTATSRATLTPAGTVSVSPITPAGAVTVGSSPLSGPVAMDSITPAGSVRVSSITPAGAVRVDSITPAGSVTVRPFTPAGSVSGTVSVSSMTLSTSNQAPPAPGVQLLFCVAEA